MEPPSEDQRENGQQSIEEYVEQVYEPEKTFKHRWAQDMYRETLKRYLQDKEFLDSCRRNGVSVDEVAEQAVKSEMARRQVPLGKLSPILARAFYRNIRVGAFVVRSLLTGEVAAVGGYDDLSFRRPDAPSVPRTEPLDFENDCDLMAGWQFVDYYCETHEIKRPHHKSKQFYRLLSDAVRNLQPDAWAPFNPPDRGEARWHPVEFVPYDWEDLPVTEPLSQAGEDALKFVKKAMLAALGLAAYLLLSLFAAICLSVIAVPVVWVILKFVPGLGEYSSWSFVVVPVGVWVIVVIYLMRSWPQLKVWAWVKSLNRRRK